MRKSADFRPANVKIDPFEGYESTSVSPMLDKRLSVRGVLIVVSFDDKVDARCSWLACFLF